MNRCKCAQMLFSIRAKSISSNIAAQAIIIFLYLSVKTHFTFYVIQVVGVCEEELKAAQQWNGSGVLNLMQTTAAFVF